MTECDKEDINYDECIRKMKEEGDDNVDSNNLDALPGPTLVSDQSSDDGWQHIVASAVGAGIFVAVCVGGYIYYHKTSADTNKVPDAFDVIVT